MSEYNVSILIPCYNEEDAILETLAVIENLISDRDDIGVIVINDGSQDNTGGLVRDHLQEFPRVKLIEHDRNRGYGAALCSGIRASKSELIAIVDADGTYPLEEIKHLIDSCHDQDMIVGARTADDVVYSNLRKIPKWFLVRYASWLIDFRIPDLNSGMRVFRREIALRYMKLYPAGFSFTTTITMSFISDKFRVKFVPISYSKRIGNSKIQPVRDTIRFLTMITRLGIYFAPLKVFLPLGGCIFLLFIGSFINDCMRHNLTDTSVILLMFSMNSVMFALLADMLKRRSSN